MSGTVLMEWFREASPRLKARIAGVLFLLLVLTAALTEFFAHGRLSSAADLAAGIIEVSCMIAVTLLFYYIFKPVNRRLSLLAASFNFVAVTILLLAIQPTRVTITVSAPPDQILCARTIASPAASVITPRINVIAEF